MKKKSLVHCRVFCLAEELLLIPAAHFERHLIAFLSFQENLFISSPLVSLYGFERDFFFVICHVFYFIFFYEPIMKGLNAGFEEMIRW